MKKILIGLLLLCSASGYAQDVQKKTSLFGKGPNLFKSRTLSLGYTDIDAGEQSPGSTVKNQNLKYDSADYLRMASTDFITAGAVGIGGTAIACSSIAIKDKNMQYAMIGVGGVCGVVAIIYFFKAAVNIGKAGEARKERGFSQLQPSKEGVGLNLSF